MSAVNTLYIISKGRPQCRTARTLEKIGYPGEWYIGCGDNDELLPDYIANWGESRVLVFDWAAQCAKTDTMDNFGFERKASGAAPARNATAELSRARGERRHWQFDDDYTRFQWLDGRTGKRPGADGLTLHRKMLQIAELADRCGLSNAGFCPASMEATKERAFMPGRRVFNAHNLPSGGPLFETWRGRLSDDLVNVIDVYRHGGKELCCRWLSMELAETQSEAGGLTEMYKADGTVRKTCYAVMAAPSAVRLAERFRRFHHRCDWDRLAPKLASDEYMRLD